ncbi:MAG: DUF485 domain-containing protein [Chthoniobacteraceae bacterium]
MSTQNNDDLTPEVGAQTDIAPLGRGAKPPHELTATEDTDPVNWTEIAETSEFKDLVRAKLRFIIPATAFFLVYYFILPISVGYYPEIMKKEVIGSINLAYLFAFSQFFMAWILAAMYVRVARGWDARAAAIVSRVNKA